MNLMKRTQNPEQVKLIAEWGGCLTGMAGAGLLALHTAISGWGFALFLLSNMFMLAYGFLSRAKGLMLMQVGFTVTSVAGIANWIFR